MKFSWLISLLACLFFAVGLFGIALAYFCDSYDDWASNIAVEGISLGLTVGVVDWIVRRSARDRLKPMLDLVIGGLRWELRNFAQGAVTDYAGTHVHTFRPIPKDVLAFLDQWLDDSDYPSWDACSVPIDDDRVPLIIHMANEMATGLQRTRELDQDLIEPELRRAIADCIAAVGRAVTSLNISRSGLQIDVPGAHRLAERMAVRAARQFGEVLLRHDDRGRLEFPDLTEEAARSQNEQLKRRAQENLRYYGR